jgi:gluconolactonase
VLIAFPADGAGGADGLKVDRRGNVWATGPGGIRVISPAGRVLGRIVLPEVAANLAFAGDGHTLYITASTSVYRLQTRVAGVIPRYARR